ncbi:hypothetical protein [Halopseudomonas pelagia]|uniref:hypothetical protein n=1 Tax=Halopseudomonas pelagia TaxID=553151 RepID=UPI0003A26583|nr:hypothetical protein [Halopseudomonas pelagia]|tara:strand:- start:460 stop:1005 length:546 start_codon:yes stop_codon:yes gene_type:complete
MSPSAQEAAQALRDIAAINARAAGFQDYQAESNQLILWGSMHVIGFILTALFPQQILFIWIPLILLALAIGCILAVRAVPLVQGVAWRYLVLIGSILLFHIVINTIMWPVSPQQGTLVAPLLVCTLYVFRGVHLRPRYLLIGVLVATLCLLGYAFFTAFFWWWMAFAYGGVFVLFGLWLRR